MVCYSYDVRVGSDHAVYIECHVMTLHASHPSSRVLIRLQIGFVPTDDAIAIVEVKCYNCILFV